MVCAATHLYVDDEEEGRVRARLDEGHSVPHATVSADVIHPEQVVPALQRGSGCFESGWVCESVWFGLVWFGSI